MIAATLNLAFFAAPLFENWFLFKSFLNIVECLLTFIFSKIFCSNDIAPMFQALDTFNTAIVSPIYYVMFTSLTIFASVIMFKIQSEKKTWPEIQKELWGSYYGYSGLFQDWDDQSGGSIVSEICGFIVVLSGTILLHVTKDFDRSPSFRSGHAPLSPSLSAGLCNEDGGLLKHGEEDVTSSEHIRLRSQELY
ncbi:hypothetical protein HHK36_017839 [Tetracentron sinense]|uniref:Probable magnesium transporter n=1 Tax=Tetracentron sinense TaxID=13715 RepID=A0A834YYV2_TETSI|nr:hypothetical protein HHK36_017839 [Tetracentron sinense]